MSHLELTIALLDTPNVSPRDLAIALAKTLDYLTSLHSPTNTQPLINHFIHEKTSLLHNNSPTTEIKSSRKT